MCTEGGRLLLTAADGLVYTNTSFPVGNQTAYMLLHNIRESKCYNSRNDDQKISQSRHPYMHLSLMVLG